MASDDLAVAHLRRFSIPVHYDSSEKKTPYDRDDSHNDDVFGHNEDVFGDNEDAVGHNESRRHRRKKSKKKHTGLPNGETEYTPKDKVEDTNGKGVYDTSDNCTEGESTCREVTAGESPEDDEEVPHHRLKIDHNTYSAARRRSSSGTSRRKSHPNASHRRNKQKPVLPISPNELDGNGLEDELNSTQLDETDIVYQADVSRTYESVSDYVQSDVALLDTNCAGTFKNGYKRARKRNSANENTDFELIDDDVNTARLKFALKIHLGFRSFGMLTHGLVAGLAIAQCIFVFSYSTSDDIDNANSTTRSNEMAMGSYSQVAVLFQSLYYLFLAVSIVSILDRFINIDSDWTQLLQFLIAKPLRAVTLISYLLSFIFSVSLAELDGIISTYTTSEPTKTTPHQVNTWKVLNMFRVVTSIVGWVSVAFSPLDDITHVTLENVMSQEKRCKLNSSPVASLHEDI